MDFVPLGPAVWRTFGVFFPAGVVLELNTFFVFPGHLARCLGPDRVFEVDFSPSSGCR